MFPVLPAVKPPDATIPVIPNVSAVSASECGPAGQLAPPPPRLQRQNTLIDSEPRNFQAILAKENTASEANVDTGPGAAKETLKVPVADIFPAQLAEQNYSRRKKGSAGLPSTAAEAETARKKSPTRKVSTCLEPHEPVIDSLPAPVPLSPSPRLFYCHTPLLIYTCTFCRPSLSRNVSVCSNSSFDTFTKQSGILGELFSSPIST